MKLTIDRNQNVIVNAGGKAHKTGWVAIGFQGIDDDVALARGIGHQKTRGNKTVHHTDASEQAVWRGKRADLTFDLFRSVSGWSASPTPEQIREARGNLSQTAAAELIYSTMRTWQNWESPIGSPSHRVMDPALFELFQIKAAKLK